ncbi:tryptophan halogenase family protein [Ideonella sp. DXS22W]|uniref:Tryptophan halogenase family protein n=1 Tax=Pseudaquabacterium inlustre TaxID=2984192 RepID=A0ABU9CRU5_9BURK
MTQAIRSILIVGGGTAGWLAATYLQRTLCGDPAAPVSIRLVESPEVPTIGVGEATVPTLAATLHALGIPEPLLFARTEATLKNGVRFIGWRQGGDAASDRFDHPFDVPMMHEGYSSLVHWLNLTQRGLLRAPMGDCCSVQTALMEGLRSPKLMDSAGYLAPVPYGYHIDAGLLADLLRETAVARGVIHTPGTVSAVHTGPEGISGLILADGRPLQADLYVDCTGFAGLLIDRALGVPWLSYADHLLCDRAVACPVAHEDEAPALRPYTTATAEAAGWRWEIDLQSRRGTGYVYASAHCSDDEAVATLLRSHGSRTRLADPRLLRMRIGHRARVWEKNCLSLGLASGFIEPLESTGIYLIEHALMQFVDYLPGAGNNSRRQATYNRLIGDLYDELRDFIVMHYVLSQRRDTPFWREATDAARISPALADLLALWQEKVPQATDINRRMSLFSANNYFYILAGMHQLPLAGAAQGAHIAPDRSDAALRQVAAVRRAALMQSPTMADYARKQRGAAAHAPAGALRSAPAGA